MVTQRTGPDQLDGGKSKFVTFWTSLPGLISAIGALIVALSSAGIIVASNQSPDPPGPTAQSVSVTTQPGVETVSFSLLVGLRPEYGQLTEEMELLIDGVSAASWTASSQNPSQTMLIDKVSAGVHRYEFKGQYSYLDPQGVVEQRPATGSGSVTIAANAAYGIMYVGNNVFQMQLLP